MARNVFYSFHYSNDINRVMVVRNRWVTQGGQTISGVVDRASFETIRQQGDNAVHKWIDSQLQGTSVTVVLIGAETLKRPFVQYEICESIKRGNAIIGIYINKIADMQSRLTSSPCNPRTVIGYYPNNVPAYFDNVCDGIYDYILDNGYLNLGSWVEKAAKAKGK